MSDARVLHGSCGGVQVLRFIGDIRYPISPSVTAFLALLFATEEIEGFVVDLTETSSIDSTNLGVLARIANRMRELGGKRVTLVSNRPDINEVLTSMGFREVFDFVEQAPTDSDTTTEAVEIDPPAVDELAQVMLDAHRALLDCGGVDGDKFREVVTMLEQAVQKP